MLMPGDRRAESNPPLTDLQKTEPRGDEGARLSRCCFTFSFPAAQLFLHGLTHLPEGRGVQMLTETLFWIEEIVSVNQKGWGRILI